MLTFQELKDKYKLNISGIIHIGAHKGTEIDEYINLGVTNMVLFEPIKDIFIELKNNISKYLNCNIVAHNVAIGPENYIASLNISTNDKMSSSILKPDKHLSQYPDIKFDSIEEIKVNTLDSYNYSTYNFLNIDVQGYELEALKGSIETLKHIDYIYCEVNRESLYENNAMIEDIDEFLSLFNFKRVDTDWFCGTWGEAFYIKEKKEFNWGSLPEIDILTIQREIFQEKVYDTIKSVKENDIVMDIGSSVGPFVYSVLDNKPKKIYCIEPSQKLLNISQDNISIKQNNTELIYINKAIGDSNDTINIFGGDSNFDTISFKNLIKDYNIDHIDFLKIDCEGGEYSIFIDENIDYLKNNINFIAMEIHLSYPGHKDKFKNFRDNYLKYFPNYEIRSCTTQNIDYGKSIDLKPYINNNEFIDNYCCEIMIYIDNTNSVNDLFTKFALDTENPDINFDLAYYYHSIGQTASAFSHYLRCAERTKNNNLAYECFLRGYFCYESQGDREFTGKHLLKQAIALLPKRPEAYYLLSKFYSDRKEWYDCYLLSSIALEVCNFESEPLKTYIGYNNKYSLLYEKAISAWWWEKVDESKQLLNTILEDNINIFDENTINHIHQMIVNIEKQQQIHTPYSKTDFSKFKFKFPQLETINNNYSQCYQDMFILAMTNGKTNGTYLEIGAGDPYAGSNTALLEKQFNWKGISIELDNNKVDYFKQERNNSIICSDATKVNYVNLLDNLNYGFNIDYLQLDCEPPNITFEALLRIPFDKYKFAVITYEHDYCVDITKSYRDKSRKYLQSYGYELIVDNISCNETSPFEDWWVHPDLIDKDLIEKMRHLSSSTKQAKKYMLL